MWDLALDGETGDIIFSPTHDLLGATGDGLTQQRILLRCRIPRGAWQYDEEGTLGSRLASHAGVSSVRMLNEAPGFVREALEPMDDISVGEIQVATDENNRIVVSLNYTNVVNPDDEGAVVIDDTVPTIDATMTI
jgi:hypothetical protein